MKWLRKLRAVFGFTAEARSRRNADSVSDQIGPKPPDADSFSAAVAAEIPDDRRARKARNDAKREARAELDRIKRRALT